MGLLEIVAELESATEGQQADRMWKAGAAVFGEEYAGETAQRFVWFMQKEAYLDAAMSLVPEGWDWTTQTSFRKSKARASCDLTQEAPFKPEDWKVTTARAATPALALCAAALRAHMKEGK